jgi:DNA primase
LSLPHLFKAGIRALKLRLLASESGQNTVCSDSILSEPMRFPPHFLDDIRARLSVSQVVGRKVALKKKGREFAGLSPFKVEKTPSFFVNDQKGFYHCFASGEHGDIFTFVMKTDGLSFPEAVERLAEEAGLAMPQMSPRDEARENEHARLYRLLETAAKFFEAKLATGAGGEARRYLEKRGLRRETISAFRIGYAPHDRSALRQHLTEAGFSAADMIASGMLIAGDDIPVAYDRFRHRVIFPITDLKNRVIAFGGRALDPGQPAKYLNSPDTPLFHKGRLLFNAYSARAPTHERGRIVAVEGYMDVIALSEAGFAEAVAPLGTALTEDQLKLLWRMTPEPILCFDGDGAGRKAAFRTVETILPLLKPGFSVRFVFLPDGLDPDDLIRQKGADAFASELEKTHALFDVLWEREEQGHALSTPEQRAAFETRLRALVAVIGDTTVRTHYERELRDTLWTLNRTIAREIARGEGSRRKNTGGGTRRNNVTPDWRLRERARLGAGKQTSLQKHLAPSPELAQRSELSPAREALLVKTVLNHPWLIEDHAEQIAGLALASRVVSRLRDAILTLHALDNSLDSEALRTQLSRSGLDKVVDLVERSVTHRSDRFAQPNAPQAAEVEDGWRHTLALHEWHGLQESLEAAVQAWHRDGSEDALARICEIKGQLAQASEPPGHSSAVEPRD